MKPVPDIPHLTHTRCQYGPHHLQRLGVWTWPSTVDSEEQAGAVPGRGHQPPRASCWVIFIHGGSWRDPRNTYEDFVPSIKAVLESSDIAQSAIRGFASLDYRLSPHPSFPQALGDTPATDLRNAQHPDHILDIQAAIAYLDKNYGMGQDYILIGHSAGATLTYQLLMGDTALAGQSGQPIPLPRVVIGVSGIYDLQGLVTRFEGVHGGIYRTFVTGAFGSDEELWKKASPVHYHDKYSWSGGTIAMLAWSPEDTLIDEPEIDSMIRKMEGDGTPMAAVKDLTGDHEVVWEQGHQVARLVAEALKHMAGDT